jgi:predicted SprT family Zn-dependent metalloprotease
MEKLKKNGFEIYRELNEAYDFYNKELFEGSLPNCIITLARHEKYMGYFRPKTFVHVQNNELFKHEIMMNMTYLAVRKIEESLSTLVHEMVHLKTFIDGTYGRGKYHNKTWANLMKSFGLQPSTTGRAGGKETGQAVSHYIIPEGIFSKKTQVLIEKGYLIPYVEMIYKQVKEYEVDDLEKIKVKGKSGFYIDNEGNEFQGREVNYGGKEDGKEVVKIIPMVTNKYRVCYKCSCGYSVFGKRDLDMRCNKCGNNFVET